MFSWTTLQYLNIINPFFPYNRTEEFLGFDKPISPFVTAKGSEIQKGVNYGSGGAGILDETGELQVINKPSICTHIERQFLVLRLLFASFIYFSKKH